MSVKLMLLVSIGGALGSLLRYILSISLSSFSPWTTVMVNVLGGFTIGILYKYTEGISFSEQIRAFGVIGFCGGFTTFSTFGIDFLNLFRQDQIGMGILYVFVSVTATIGAVFFGIRILT
jgi:CrcB protein